AVLLVVPARPEPELDPPTAHRVDLRDADRERTRQPERDRRHERAEPDARGVAREPGERDPRVGRAGKRVARAHPGVVIGTEEGVETEFLAQPGDGELLVVRRALLRFDEDPEAHAPTLVVPPDARRRARRLARSPYAGRMLTV